MKKDDKYETLPILKKLEVPVAIISAILGAVIGSLLALKLFL